MVKYAEASFRGSVVSAGQLSKAEQFGLKL